MWLTGRAVPNEANLHLQKLFGCPQCLQNIVTPFQSKVMDNRQSEAKYRYIVPHYHDQLLSGSDEVIPKVRRISREAPGMSRYRAKQAGLRCSKLPEHVKVGETGVGRCGSGLESRNGPGVGHASQELFFSAAVSRLFEHLVQSATTTIPDQLTFCKSLEDKR